MKEVSRIVIPITGRAPRSLHWHADELVDWVGGIARYHLDKSIVRAKVNFAFPFDDAIVSPGGEFVALYERLGTKGLILKQGKVIREINRSFYHASDYEYPIAFLKLPNGRTGLVHCPTQYCQLEIEDPETGEKLTRPDTKPADFFHSRLSVGQDGHYLLSVGWIWHPFEYVSLFDVLQTISPPNSFGDGEFSLMQRLARNSVTIPSGFVTNERIIFTTEDNEYDPNEERDADEAPLLAPKMIGQYDIARQMIVSSAPLEETAGMIYPFGSEHVIGFYQYPKIIECATGRVVAKWEEFHTGEQTSCIVGTKNLLPPLAIDSIRKRFAIASEKEISVIQLGAE